MPNFGVKQSEMVDAGVSKVREEGNKSLEHLELVFVQSAGEKMH